VERRPLANDFASIRVGLCGIPRQHLRPILNPDFPAIGLDNPRGLIQQVLRVNDTEVAVADNALREEEVEQGAELAVADLGRDEVVVVGLVAHGRRGEAVHAGRAEARVPNEERPLVGAKDADGDRGRVGRFRVRVVGEGGGEAEVSIAGGAEGVSDIFYEDSFTLAPMLMSADLHGWKKRLIGKKSKGRSRAWLG